MAIKLYSAFQPDNTVWEQEARWKIYETAWKLSIFSFICYVAQRPMHRPSTGQIFLISFKTILQNKTTGYRVKVEKIDVLRVLVLKKIPITSKSL